MTDCELKNSNLTKMKSRWVLIGGQPTMRLGRSAYMPSHQCLGISSLLSSVFVLTTGSPIR